MLNSIEVASSEPIGSIIQTNLSRLLATYVYFLSPLLIVLVVINLFKVSESSLTNI
jgi:hypothetical protein